MGTKYRFLQEPHLDHNPYAATALLNGTNKKKSSSIMHESDVDTLIQNNGGQLGCSFWQPPNSGLLYILSCVLLCISYNFFLAYRYWIALLKEFTSSCACMHSEIPSESM